MTRCYRCVQRYVYATTQSRAKKDLLQKLTGGEKDRPISPFNWRVTTLVSLPRERGAVRRMRLFVHFIVPGASTIRLPVMTPTCWLRRPANSRELPQQQPREEPFNAVSRKGSHRLSRTAAVETLASGASCSAVACTVTWRRRRCVLTLRIDVASTSYSDKTSLGKNRSTLLSLLQLGRLETAGCRFNEYDVADTHGRTSTS